MRTALLLRRWREAPELVLGEDDDCARAALVRMFAGDGLLVRPHATGRGLLEYLRGAAEMGRLPDIVVIGQRMPGCSSAELLDHIARMGWQLPVVVMSAHGDDVRDPDHKLSANAIFRRPFDVDDLRTAVFYWLDHPLREPAR